jgi:protoporphyrinogen oxidase
MAQHPVVVLGAGAAGLSAAWDLARAGAPVIVLEQEESPGGLCRTFERDGYRFDLGGHRFLSQDEHLTRDVAALLGSDLLEATRRSVILLGGKRFQYPLEALDLARNLGLGPGARGFADYLRERLSRPPPDPGAEESFRDWTQRRYGRTFYDLFFGPYTEKLWGIPPQELTGDWASQRISLLDLTDVALRLLKLRGGETRTYARRYYYPRKGIGQIFTAMARDVERLGGQVMLGARVVGLTRDGARVREVQVRKTERTLSLPCADVISTLPLPDLARLLFPDDDAVSAAADKLRFRAVRFLNVLLDCGDVSPNTWMYVADRKYLATRVQEPRRRSPESAPPGKSSLMLEIPCDVGDRTWDSPDDELLARCLADLDGLGLHVRAHVRSCFSTRVTHGYPAFRMGYRAPRDQLLKAVGEVTNVVTCGRQGTFRYIFMDTAMQMGRLAAGRVLGRSCPEPIAGLHNEPVLLETRAVTA